MFKSKNIRNLTSNIKTLGLQQPGEYACIFSKTVAITWQNFTHHELFFSISYGINNLSPGQR